MREVQTYLLRINFSYTCQEDACAVLHVVKLTIILTETRKTPATVHFFRIFYSV